MTTDFQCWGKALTESFFSSITKPSALSVKKRGKPAISG
jgi:hypothetical protein